MWYRPTTTLLVVESSWSSWKSNVMICLGVEVERTGLQCNEAGQGAKNTHKIKPKPTRVKTGT